MKIISITILLLFSSCSFYQNPVLSPKSLSFKSKYLGVAVNSKFTTDLNYKNIVIHNFNSITPENALKMDSIFKNKNALNYNQADVIINQAINNNLRVHGHTLVWHRQVPAWLSYEKNHLIQKYFNQYISEIVKKYKNKVQEWDVVNEALDKNGLLRKSIWLKAIGPKYIENAFSIANKANPEAKLYYNENGIEKPGLKRDALIKMLERLRNENIPIHGVGIQSHFSTNYRPEQLEVLLNKLTELDLEFQFTELDYALKINDKDNAAAIEKQNEIFKYISETCSKYSNCRGVTIWGLSDQDSWIPSFYPKYGGSTLFKMEGNNYLAKDSYNYFLSK